ncbi:MAG: prolyl oligopeptidase family serine peptidase [Acidobacteria bacterium]|nr:prolyl oligopeptidase family serine peptidase [Acidobacteriota bacterium]
MRHRLHSMRGLVLVVCVLVTAVGLSAQPPAKRPVPYDAYDSWKSIQGTKISRDGTWLVYTLAAQDGDGELVVRNLKSGTEKRQARGKDGVITADDRFVVFAIAPPKADVDKAKREKKKPEEQPKGGLGILNLATGDVFTADRVKSFKVADESGKFVAYLLEAPEKKAEAKDDKKEGEPKPEAKADAPKKPKEKKKDPGTDLLVRELATGTQATINEVVEYVWTKDGSWLAYGTSSVAKTPEKDGAFARRMSDGVTKTLLSGLGHYKSFAFDDKAAQLAFLADRDSYKENPATCKLFHWLTASDVATELVAASTKGMPAGMTVSENGKTEFSKDGARLFFGYARPPAAEAAEDAPEPVKVDIWNSKDPLLQPMQKVRADDEKKRSFRAVVHLKDKRLVPLASEDMPDLTVIDTSAIALGASDVAYRQLVSWDAEHNDYYAVSLQDGSRKKLLEKTRFAASLSPGGTHVLTFNADDSQWYSVRVSDGFKTSLTGKLGVRFDDESNDTPEPARAYGSPGWTSGDRSVLLYDKYDIWEVRPDGTEARMVTGGHGRKARIVFRYVRTDPEEKTLPTDKPFVLSALDDLTKATGYYRVAPTAAPAAPATKPAKPAKGAPAPPPPAPLPPGYAEPQKLVMLDKQLGSPGVGGPGGGGPGGGGGGGTLLKPKNADSPIILTAQRFDEFPDLWAAGPNFENMAKISNANPQMAQYVWGRSELVDYRNDDGKMLRAILTKPETFDPSKKYPLMVYIYEELTNGLHRFVAPAPGTSINVSRYVSAGYIVMQPDIVYDTGYPGESAYKCVIPAVQQLVAKGFVDPARIGIQGHSWGGYQITYLITRTDIFRAVEAGASVSNMVSAYGGIRWGSGMSRAFQYERTQSRIGAPPWIRSLQFIENSPIFWVEKVNTPYLTIANDEDDAVPWYQGIEFFSALRRLGKEAYMFNFNGEKHGLRERENQKYWTIHLDEFFDHYLLGKARPEWMDKGVPYLERGKRDVSGYYKKPAEQK